MNTMLPRVGIGHDRHRLVLGKGFRLGGVFIPFDHALLGHSDADVLLHAVTDAVLGAAAMGDIGDMFPDTDAANANRSSIDMLRQAYAKVRELGWGVRNVDCIVFAERPKLANYKTEIARSIAQALEITPQQVNVKAKTGEGIGPVGEGVIIEAQSVVLIVPTRTQGEGLKTLFAARPIPAAVTMNASPILRTPRIQTEPVANDPVPLAQETYPPET